MMKVALITGITGQDGSYLAELLLGKAYRIVGAVRDLEAAHKSLPAGLAQNVELVQWNMISQPEMEEVIRRVKPYEIYNFAAHSSGSGMYDDPVGIAEVNGLAVLRILEAIRAVDTKIRLCQASSREIFGEAVETPQTETTPTNPRSPYGAAKAFADASIRIYRQRYGIFATSAILFNHESPRRGLSFVTRKITHEAARIKLGLGTQLSLGNLDAQRDWGFAGDYVRAMWLILQQTRPDDYVVGTGESHSVREFCEHAFGHLGLDYRDYVREDKNSYRPNEPTVLVGWAGKAQRELGWSPELGFKSLVGMMVDADLELLKAKMNNEQDIHDV
jgi:GDPmannose 4,6-dehydratase